MTPFNCSNCGAPCDCDYLCPGCREPICDRCIHLGHEMEYVLGKYRCAKCAKEDKMSKDGGAAFPCVDGGCTDRLVMKFGEIIIRDICDFLDMLSCDPWPDNLWPAAHDVIQDVIKELSDGNFMTDSILSAWAELNVGERTGREPEAEELHDELDRLYRRAGERKEGK